MRIRLSRISAADKRATPALLRHSRWGGEVKETIESLIAKAVANSRKRQYPAHKTQQDPMKRLLLLALTAVTLLMGTSASACEQHLNGHQNGSDTDLEGSKK